MVCSNCHSAIYLYCLVFVSPKVSCYHVIYVNSAEGPTLISFRENVIRAVTAFTIAGSLPSWLVNKLLTVVAPKVSDPSTARMASSVAAACNNIQAAFD